MCNLYSVHTFQISKINMNDDITEGVIGWMMTADEFLDFSGNVYYDPIDNLLSKSL